MNSENSKTLYPYRLVLNLTDKMDLLRGDKCVALHYYIWKNMKHSTETINLKY